MKFGELIGRVTSSIRFKFSTDKDLVFSVKGMALSELMKIQQDGPEIFSLIEPILLEYDHLLLERFSNNPKMTMGEIRDHYKSQFQYISQATSAELRIRPKKQK